MRKPAAIILTQVLCLLFLLRPAPAQTPDDDLEDLKKTAVKVYLDCAACDIDYIKTEITFVNYVRDRMEAQVHILVTTQTTGGGGREYTLAFLGQNSFKDINDVQKYFSNPTDTADDIRRGLTNALKLGLMSYVARTPIARRMSVDYRQPAETGPDLDRWDSWLFSLSGSGFFMGEESYMDRTANFSFSAGRVTPETKIRLGLSNQSSKKRFTVEGEDITGSWSSWNADGFFVKSLGRRWSAGVFLEASSSLYSNIDIRFAAAPAIEYNIFPYEESTRRQFRILYRLDIRPVKYREETIYGKTRETLFRESLSATLDLREKWGTVSVSASGGHFLHDFSRNRTDVFGIVNLRLYKGLSLFVFGGYSWIKDQIALPAREPTFEERLLRLREFPMTSNHFISVGLQFTFGSIFTNVINPRFGSTGSGGMHIVIN
jgi:hypothetical protein